MRNRLSKRNRRAIIVLAGVVGVTLFFSYVVLPFYDAQEEVAKSIEQKRRELALSLRTLEEQETYLGGLGQAEGLMVDYDLAFLDARDSSSATLQMEEAIRAFAAQNGVRVTRSNPLPERKVGEQYVQISLQVNLESDLISLVNFLHSLAAYDKYLSVDEFTLASFRVRDQTQIRPRMRISGFIRLS